MTQEELKRLVAKDLRVRGFRIKFNEASSLDWSVFDIDAIVRELPQKGKERSKPFTRPVTLHCRPVNNGDPQSASHVADAIRRVYYNPDLQGCHVIRHWLYGDCFFKEFVVEETSCRSCVHSYVCSRNMQDVCVNFSFGSSGKTDTCDVCHHRFTRYANKGAIPCFMCRLFVRRSETHSSYCYEVWSNPRPKADSWWRRGIVRAGGLPLAAKTIHEEDPSTLGGPDCGIEFLPITKAEFEYHATRIREAKAEGGSLLLTNYSEET